MLEKCFDTKEITKDTASKYERKNLMVGNFQ